MAAQADVLPVSFCYHVPVSVRNGGLGFEPHIIWPTPLVNENVLMLFISSIWRCLCFFRSLIKPSWYPFAGYVRSLNFTYVYLLPIEGFRVLNSRASIHHRLTALMNENETVCGLGEGMDVCRVWVWVGKSLHIFSVNLVLSFTAPPIN